MICLRPLLVILAFCLALVAPAQASGWLDGQGRACLHPIAFSMQASAPDALPHDGIIAPPCHGLVAILETGITLHAGGGSAEFAACATRLDLPLRPAGIDRPPKRPISPEPLQASCRRPKARAHPSRASDFIGRLTR